MHPNVDPFTAPELDGLVDGLTLREYHEKPGVSRSTLIRLLRLGPWAFDYERQQGFEESDAMRLGSAIHIALLEPDMYHITVTTYPKARRGKEWEEFQEANRDWIILTPAQYTTVERIRKDVAGRKGIRSLLDRGLAERSYFHTDEETGELVKSRPDFIAPERGYVLDVKTCHNVGARHRATAMVDFGYAMQGALLLESTNRVYNGAIREAVVLWVKTTGAPVAVLRTLSAEWLELGRLEYRKALDLWHKCSVEDKWPQEGLEICDEFVPPWVQEKLESLRDAS